MKHFLHTLAAGCLAILSSLTIAQDTFSIVALDSVTGEVGSAGASCVDLNNLSVTDHFIGELLPDRGAINTQAWYDQTNQFNARTQMLLGNTPDSIINWLNNNDVGNSPQLRQYGIVAFVNGSPQSAGFTGTSTDDYKNHVLGPTYAIQGNILLNQGILDSMEARFNREPGDLACKLMAALQGANTVGADSRCAPNGTSSLFAYVKVAQPNDVFGNPSFLVSVRTADGDGIEPIDSLQTLFDATHSCQATGIAPRALAGPVQIWPNPATDQVTIQVDHAEPIQYQLVDLQGRLVRQGQAVGTKIVPLEDLPGGMYFLWVQTKDADSATRLVKR